MVIPTTILEWGSLPTPSCTEPRIAPKEVEQECGGAVYPLEPKFPKQFEAIYCVSYEYNERPVQFLIRLKNTETNEAIEPALQNILDDINELSKEEDRDGYIFKPTPRARRSAKAFITEAYKRTEGRLPRPRVVPDGKGGIIMEWRNGENLVKLGCVSADTRRDYIYYRRGNIYDVIEASVDDLIKWLTS